MMTPATYEGETVYIMGFLGLDVGILKAVVSTSDGSIKRVDAKDLKVRVELMGIMSPQTKKSKKNDM